MVYSGRAGYSHPISAKAADAAQVDVGLGWGIAESTGVVAHNNWLRSKFGPGLFHLGLYPAILLNLFANQYVAFNLNTGFEAAGIDVVQSKPSFSIASPFADLGIGFSPPSMNRLIINLAFGAEYRIRAREDVPNAGYLNLTLGVTYAADWNSYPH